MQLVQTLRLSGPASFGFALLGLLWGAFAAFVPVFKAGLGVSDASFGAVLLGSSCGLLAAMWIAPALDRKLGSLSLPLGGLALLVSWGLLPFVPTPMAFAMVLAVTGLSSGIVDVVMNARVSDAEAETARPLLSANHGVFSLSYGLSAIASGLAREAGLPVWAVFAGIGLVGLFLLPRTRVAPPAMAEDAAQQARLPLGLTVHLCGVIVLCAFSLEAAVESWSALHLERGHGSGPLQSALGPGLLGLTMAVGRFVGNSAEGRYGTRRVIVAGILLGTGGGLCAAFAQSLWLAYLGFALLGLGVSVVGPLGIALAGRRTSAPQRVSAVARAAVMGFAGFFFAPVIMGWLSAASSLSTAFAVMALIMLLALPLALRVTRPSSET